MEYKLTEIGQSLIPIMDSLCAWGKITGGKSTISSPPRLFPHYAGF
ncbi:winged helix-turn-helix transcriptional regulator [Dyadobacter sp. OTU695]